MASAEPAPAATVKMRGPSQRSAGCDRQAWQHNLWLPKGLQPGGEVELTLAYKPSSGLSTRYKLSVPTHYSGIVSWPLLVGFHGWGGSGSHSLDAFHAHGKAAGYIVDASSTRFRLTEGCKAQPDPDPNQVHRRIA